MKTRIIVLLLTTVTFIIDTLGAVDFSISPNTISNTNSGIVNLQITGLNAGETVQVNHYYDVNGNGAVDASDILAENFQLTDGQQKVIGGITDINVPGDTNSAVGAITAPLDFSIASFDQKLIGKHLYVVSSPTARFAAVTSTLTITNAAFGQNISGTVTSSGAPMPNAIIILLVPSGGNYNPGSGVACDASGHFSIAVPAGTYLVAPFKVGYITQFASEPLVSLASGASSVVAPTLSASDRTISGRVVDAANTSVGLAGIQMTVQSSTGGFVLAYSDATGAFSIGVNSGTWKMGLSNSSLQRRGLLRPDKQSVSTTGGNVGNVTFAVPKETALVYGQIVDEQGQPFPMARPFFSSQSNLEASGLSDSNGNYVLGAVQGTWSLDFDAPLDPAFANYLFPNIGGVNVTSGTAVRMDVVVRKPTSTISGYLHNSSGQPITNVNIYANAPLNGGGNYSAQATTDSNGLFTIYVTDGAWNLNVDCDYMQSHGFQCNNAAVAHINGANISVGLVAGQTAPEIITETLPNAQSQESYSATLEVNGNGQFHWSISNGALPPGLNLSNSGVISGSPTAMGGFNFTVRLANGDTFTEAAYSINVPLTGLGWTRKAFMPSPRYAAAAVALNGKMYLVGGVGNDNYNALQVYDPAHGTWQTLAPMAVGRTRLAASVINGKIYAGGGSGDFNSGTAFEVFDPQTSQWTTLPSMNTSHDGGVSGVISNKLYVVGGTSDPIRSVEIYDPSTSSWSYGEPVPTARYSPVVAVVNNKLYAIGGAQNNQNLGVVEAYDPATETWSVKGAMPFDGSDIAGDVVNGKVFVVGGYSKKFYSYNPANDQWTQLPDTLTSRGDVAAANVGDSFFVAGGDVFGGPLPILEQYRSITGDPVHTSVFVSDLNAQGVGIGFGVPSISKFDRLNAGTVTGLTFAPVLQDSSGLIMPPNGAPAASAVITIAPGDGENGFFKTKFTLPDNYVDAQLSFASSADDMSRVFLNGVAITPAMAQGVNYLNQYLSVTTPSLFHAGDNELLIANANYFGGSSSVAFYGVLTYRGVLSLGRPVRTSTTSFQFTAAVEPPLSYTVEYSTDLKNWSLLMNTNVTTTSITIVDPAAGGTVRAYRISNP